MARDQAVALARKDEIISRIAKGEPITKIAQDMGYDSHSGIINRLGDDPDYDAALRSGVYAKLEQREKELAAADTNVTVTRADRLLGHARWWAESIDKQRFGKNAQPGVTGEQLADLLMAVSGRMLREKQVEALPGDNKE